MPGTMLAPAKLNLCLYVGPKREDGLHEIRSVFEPLELADELRLSEADADAVICEGIEGPDLTAKKKAFLVNDASGTLAENGDVDDPDGSKLQILYGRKKTGNLVSTPGGKLTLKAGKKFTTLALSLDGLDLTKLLAADATSGAFRLQIGRDTAVKPVTLKAAKGGRKFH